MIYEFQNAEGDVIEKSFSLKEEIPKSVTHKGEKYIRKFSSSIHIPENFKANRPFNYDKSPSKKKHIY